MTRRKVAPADNENCSDRDQAKGEMVVPVVEEQLKVGKRTVESGRVVVTKHIEEREAIVDEPLLKEEVEIERVAVNRQVDRVMPVRREGDVMIIPVMEEVLVVERRLMLKEELHVRRKASQTRQPQRVTLRRERAEIKRMPPGAQQ